MSATARDPRDTVSSIASFGADAPAYRDARPSYPACLFKWIVGHAPGRARALDCATGNGQAAISLASFFDQVDAFDGHEKQIESAIKAKNITYRVAQAEETPYADNSFDVITCGQAIHWFDHDRFWPEIARLAKPGALFCAFGYNRFLSDDALENGLVKPILELIQPFWSYRNLLVWDGYDSHALQCPFPVMEMPPMPLNLQWTAHHYLAFLESLSATRKARKDPALNDQLDGVIKAFVAGYPIDEILDLRSHLFTLAVRF